MAPNISINTSNKSGSVTLQLPNGAIINVSNVILGEIGKLTGDEQDALVRRLTREALHEAAGKL